jgi:hypothetical protein
MPAGCPRLLLKIFARVSFGMRAMKILANVHIGGPMKLRKLLLRVMLCSLAVAAAVGVLAVLFFSEITARVVGTAITTAVAAGLMMVLSLVADRERFRASGTLGMAAVVAEYLLGLLMIWGIDAIAGYQWEASAAALMLTIAGVVLPAMFYLRMTLVPMARIAAWVGVGVCAVVFMLFAVPAWITASWMDYGNWCSTAACLGVFGVAATASLAGAGFDRRHWRYVGVLAAGAAFVMGTIGIWRDLHQGPLAFAIIASLAAVVAHANLVLLCPLKPHQRWLAWATIACAVLTAVGVDVTMSINNEVEDLLARISGAASILAGCGSLALLVLAGLNRKVKPKAVLSKIEEFTLICPGCNKRHTLPVGDARCPTCLLETHVSFTEPRCPKCDYLLFMLQSDRCPECGTVVRGPGPAEDAGPVASLASPPQAEPAAVSTSPSAPG